MDKNQLRVRFDLVFNTSTTLNKDAQELIQIASANGITYLMLLKVLVDVVEEELLKNLRFHPREPAISDALGVAQAMLKEHLKDIIPNGELAQTISNVDIETRMDIN